MQRRCESSLFGVNFVAGSDSTLTVPQILTVCIFLLGLLVYYRLVSFSPPLIIIVAVACFFLYEK
jgi:hypothetical protein